MEPVLIRTVDSEAVVPPSRRFWTTPEMYDPDTMSPTYAMGVVAQFFFFKSTAWLRQKLRIQRLDDLGRPMFHEDGRKVIIALEDDLGPIEPPRTVADHHAWRLHDIERLAHFFARHHVIDVDTLLQVIRVIKNQAKGHGYLS